MVLEDCQFSSGVKLISFKLHQTRLRLGDLIQHLLLNPRHLGHFILLFRRQLLLKLLLHVLDGLLQCRNLLSQRFLLLQEVLHRVVFCLEVLKVRLGVLHRHLVVQHDPLYLILLQLLELVVVVHHLLVVDLSFGSLLGDC